MRRQRNRAQQMFREYAFAIAHIGFGERVSRRCQMQMSVAQFGKAEHLRYFDQVEKIGGRKMQPRRQGGQIGLTAEGRGRQDLRHRGDPRR